MISLVALSFDAVTKAWENERKRAATASRCTSHGANPLVDRVFIVVFGSLLDFDQLANGFGVPWPLGDNDDGPEFLGDTGYFYTENSGATESCEGGRVQ